MTSLAFGVGMAKTGTSTLASMFRECLRTAHEPDPSHLIGLACDHTSGLITGDQLQRSLQQIFARQNLQLNVSQINGVLIEALCDVFPESNMVLTIRDPYSWLRSLINHQISRPTPPENPWHAFRQLRFGSPACVHTQPSESLQKAGLYPLDAYLGYWTDHNSRILERVPPERLFVVSNRHLKRDATHIATFLGVGSNACLHMEDHTNRGQYGADPLTAISTTYLRQRVHHYRALLLARAQTSRCCGHTDAVSDATMPADGD